MKTSSTDLLNLEPTGIMLDYDFDLRMEALENAHLVERRVANKYMVSGLSEDGTAVYRRGQPICWDWKAPVGLVYTFSIPNSGREAFQDELGAIFAQLSMRVWGRSQLQFARRADGKYFQKMYLVHNDNDFDCVVPNYGRIIDRVECQYDLDVIRHIAKPWTDDHGLLIDGFLPKS